ncbi:MAG TPA: GDSL-type esterase/lipase family protein [Actinomycetes bacterium]
MARRILVVLVLAMAAVLPSGAPAQAADRPTRMAALGDSITRGFNACGWYVDCPSRSWSTGSYSTVNSHYRRLAVQQPLTAYNDARSGAKISALAGQVSSAVSQQAQYVTILLGANDACTSTEAGMTTVSDFTARLDTGMDALHAGLPGATVFVSSIPDIKRLWEIGRNSFSARSAWSAFGICQSMLANPRSTTAADIARRDRVRQRVVDYNAALSQACATYAGTCVFDDNAVFTYQFTLSQVSSWDYFHPNTSGQAVLASVTWPKVAASTGW